MDWTPGKIDNISFFSIWDQGTDITIIVYICKLQRHFKLIYKDIQNAEVRKKMTKKIQQIIYWRVIIFPVSVRLSKFFFYNIINETFTSIF